jgi:transposase InsO family protein
MDLEQIQEEHMAERTSEKERLEFYRRNLLGETYAEIAQARGVSLECVRYWCQKQKKGLGVKSEWHFPRQGVLSQFHSIVIERIKTLRRDHPGRGPVSLRLNLSKELDLKREKIPSASSIGRFLHQDPANRRKPRPKQPGASTVPLTHSHQRWEIDFKVKIHLACGETVQLHTVTDPFSGAHIGAYIYLSGSNTSRVALQDVQATLRACFTQWGTLPDEIQTDGEPVLAAAHVDLPTGFTLWLAGLGVRHHKIHSGRPTENGSVERGHRTLDAYSLQGQLHLSRIQLQAYLHQCREELNTGYPSRAKGCSGQPPLTAHPELLQPLHAYQPEYEALLFDLNRVDAFLAAFRWERKVGKMGQVTIGAEKENYFVGRAWARQNVQIRFDPEARDFVAEFPDDTGQLQEIKRWPARNLDAHPLLWPGQPPQSHFPQQLALPILWIGNHAETEKVNC